MGRYLLDLWDNHSVSIIAAAGNIVAAALIIIIGLVLSRGTQRLFTKAGSGGLQMNGTAASLLRIIARYGIFIICVIMILNVFGVNTTSLIAVLGAAGVAVGLALKDTLGNIASGIILMLLGTCRVGEFIEFGGYMGTVKEINLFTTILETPDGVHISAPNSSIWDSPVKNYVRTGRRRMDISVNISYSDSIETAFDVMRNIIASEPRFLTDPAPQVILQSISDGSVTITIRAWAAAGDYWNIYWDQMRAVKPQIEAAGLHIPLPQRDVHIAEPHPVT